MNLFYQVLIRTKFYIGDALSETHLEGTSGGFDIFSNLKLEFPQEKWVVINNPWGKLKELPTGSKPLEVELCVTDKDSGTRSGNYRWELNLNVISAEELREQILKCAEEATEKLRRAARKQRLLDGGKKETEDFLFKEYKVCESTSENDRDMMRTGWKNGYYGYRFTRGDNEVSFIHIRKNNWSGNVMEYIEISSVRDGKWYAKESWANTDMTEMTEYLLSEGWKPNHPHDLKYKPFNQAEVERLHVLLITGDLSVIQSQRCGANFTEPLFVLKSDIEKGVYRLYKSGYYYAQSQSVMGIWICREYDTLEQLLSGLVSVSYGFDAFNSAEWRQSLNMPLGWQDIDGVIHCKLDTGIKPFFE